MSDVFSPYQLDAIYAKLTEDVFEPKDIDLSGSDVDEVDKEVEMFKR